MPVDNLAAVTFNAEARFRGGPERLGYRVDRWGNTPAGVEPGVPVATFVRRVHGDVAQRVERPRPAFARRGRRLGVIGRGFESRHLHRRRAGVFGLSRDQV